jgi:steroid delta-isomerase-like uncharacterized protein
MTRAEIVDLIDRWQQSVNARDMVTYASLYAESAEVHSPMAGSVVGRDGVVRVMSSFLSAFPDATQVSEPPIIDGDRVAVVSTATGTNFGGFMGLPPSGKAFRFTIVFVLDLRDGLIVRERRNYDFTGLMVQVGVLKAKPV